MNRLFISAISAYLILRIISSCASTELSGRGAIKNSALCARDITGAYIIDTFYLDLIRPSLGVQFYKGGIVFLSLSKDEGSMLSNHLSFGTVQAYYSEIGDTTTKQHQAFSSSVSFPYPCDAISFTGDFNIMYFTRESETDRHEKIYKAVNNGQQTWMFDRNPLDFCKEGFSYSHPAVSRDGTLMIFASDNTNSIGGMDLFMTKIKDNQWSDPENMGVAVNTGGNELFPFLDNENNLFFSSDSLYGFGGYDIFISKYTGKGWEIPVNLTKHINSPCDEIAFTIDREGSNTAFFTTRNNGRKGDITLYKVNLRGQVQNDPEQLSKDICTLAMTEIDSGEIKKILARLEKENIRLAMIRSDSIEAARNATARLESERIRALKLKDDSLLAARDKASRMKTDSLVAEKNRIARLEAERKLAQKAKSDSLEAARNQAARIEAERKKAEKQRADSIETARLEAVKSANKDIVIYKVQFRSSVKPEGIKEITVNGTKYPVFEYFYLGEYRYTIGEFSTLDPAKELQNLYRKYVNPQAFVVAFKNNKRTLDPELFR